MTRQLVYGGVVHQFAKGKPGFSRCGLQLASEPIPVNGEPCKACELSATPAQSFEVRVAAVYTLDDAHHDCDCMSCRPWTS